MQINWRGGIIHEHMMLEWGCDLTLRQAHTYMSIITKFSFIAVYCSKDCVHQDSAVLLIVYTRIVQCFLQHCLYQDSAVLLTAYWRNVWIDLPWIQQAVPCVSVSLTTVGTSRRPQSVGRNETYHNYARHSLFGFPSHFDLFTLFTQSVGRLLDVSLCS